MMIKISAISKKILIIPFDQSEINVFDRTKAVQSCEGHPRKIIRENNVGFCHSKWNCLIKDWRYLRKCKAQLSKISSARPSVT